MAKRRFCEFLVKGRWIFIGIFVALTIAGCVMFFFTDVLYDLSTYLPSDSDGNIGMSVLKDEFDDKGMAYVVVKGVTTKEADKIFDWLSESEGVANVVYVEMQHYVDGNAMYTVSFEDYDSSAGCFAAMKRIILGLKKDGYEAYYTGQSASSYFTKQETEDSILKLGIVIVVIILAMLLFTGKSFFELVPLIITFAVSVALNMGTNFLFNFSGGISYISNLVSLVLQLALSIDYSVILIHRYMEERLLFSDEDEAVVSAVSKGITEIFSSSLTTIAGLCALVLMALPIGREIGISLAKGIVCSLVSVIFLMPALLSLFKKPLAKSVHKPFVPRVDRFFSEILKARYIIVPVFIVIVALSGAGQFFNQYSFNMNGGDYIVKNNAKIEEAGFGKINSFVVVVPKGDYLKEREVARYVMSFEQVDSCNALGYIELTDGVFLTDEFTKEEITEMVRALAADSTENLSPDFVEYTLTYMVDDLFARTANGSDKVKLLDLMVNLKDSPYVILLGDFAPMLDSLVYAKGNLEGESYARMTFNIVSGVESEETFEFISEVKKGLGEFYDEFYITGESVVCYDMASYFPRDNMLVSTVTVCAVLVILFFTFKNLLLPLLLILAIQGGIWINFVIPFLSGTPLSFIGYLIICALQMGATIDYAIVLTNRYNTIKGDYPTPSEGMAAAENMVFPTIITSGVILTLTGAALALLSSGVVASMGSLLAIGTAFSMFIVLFVLPSLLLISEKGYEKCYFGKLFKRKNKEENNLSPSVAASDDAENKE